MIDRSQIERLFAALLDTPDCTVNLHRAVTPKPASALSAVEEVDVSRRLTMTVEATLEVDAALTLGTTIANEYRCKKLQFFGRCAGKMLKLSGSAFMCSACGHPSPCALNTVHEQHPDAQRQCRHFDDKV